MPYPSIIWFSDSEVSPFSLQYENIGYGLTKEGKMWQKGNVCCNLEVI